VTTTPPPHSGNNDINNEDVQLVDHQSGSDQTYLAILHKCFGPHWGDQEHWRNKHVRRPGFDSRDAKQFRVNDVPAACFHSSVLALTLEQGLTIPVSFEGDYAVVPEFRRKGMVEDAHQVMGQQLYERGAVLRCGFTSGDLHARVYSKKFCHVFVPTVTTTYRKILSTSLLADKLLAYVDSFRTHRIVQRVVRDKPLIMALRISGYDPCVITLTPQSATLMPLFTGRPDIDITLPYKLLAAAKLGLKPMILVSIKALLSRELRANRLAPFFRRLLWH
jgi:hypothetical protein